MKRKGKKSRRPRRSGKIANLASGYTNGSSAKATSRRDALLSLRSWGVLGLIAAGGGWYLVREVTTALAENDLSQVGNGTPTVVQIHDPECLLCRALQSETRDALCDLDDDELQYLVANLRTANGRKFAAAHGVGNVTLLLFDGDGQRQRILSGVRNSDSLEEIFRNHIQQSRKN